MPSIYLDYNSTSPIDPRVAAAMAECYAQGFANPASQHTPGRAARRRLEEAREGITELLGAKTTGMDADQVIFTSGGTEANNLALFGLAGASPGRVVVSSIEHPSVLAAAAELARRGWQVDYLPASSDGVCCLDQARALLAQPAALVSLMLANNETGVVQPVAEVAALAHSAGALVHTDAAQAAAKLPVDFRRLGVSAMSLAAHKFHGPRGVGALVLRHGAALRPLMFGGFQQAALRPGTEDVALAVGMHTALRLWLAEAAERTARLTSLRDRFESHLASAGAGNVAAVNIEILGAPQDRLPQTSCVSFPGLERQALVMALDLAGVACSTGSACASGSSEPSHVLTAMGCSAAVISGAVRFSFGDPLTAADVDEAARRILSVVNKLRRQETAPPTSATAREAGEKTL
ncbi:MAG: cysteine desulfurase [Planctomycetales bacterium]|nr:cysteine desulfurase [Planctomycetales bacterium]